MLMSEPQSDRVRPDRRHGERDLPEFDHHREERHRLMDDLARPESDVLPPGPRPDRALGHRPLPVTPDEGTSLNK
jgi:hypothetical protein